MRTSVSIPDDLFAAGELAAGRLGISRSALYVRAVRAYLDRLHRHDVTTRLDAVYGKEPSALDPAVAEAQRRTLRRMP